MASIEKPLTYEEERQRIIEENKRRMQELGLLETVESIRKQTVTKKPRIPRMPVNLEFAMETRRSSRAASRPKVDYKESHIMDIGLHRTRGIRRPLLRRGYVSPAATTEAAVRAGDIRTSHPSFVKAMLKSHTSGGFWLGLPSDFCNTNFTKDDIIILENEDGLEWECVYLHNKHGLSGGWRGFSLDHDLEDGDAVVFELVTSSRFKVFITRASVSEEPSTRKTAAVAKKRDYQYAVTNTKNVHVHSALHKTLTREKEEQSDWNTRGVCKKSKYTKTVKRNVKRGRYEGSSDENTQSDDDVVERSNDESHSADENVEDSDKEESAQSTDEDIQPGRRVTDKISRPIKRPAKSKLQLKAKTKPKARQITPGRNENSRASLKVLKKETFVCRADHKTDVQEVSKEIAARQTEQKCNLPPGTRLKPVGVCSIAKGSTKRKLPAIFPVRKYSFFSGPSIKVH